MSIVSKLLNVYGKIPVPILNAFGKIFYCFPVALRFGSVFSNQYKSLCEADKQPKYPEERINELAVKTIESAYKNVPFYIELAQKHGVNIADIKSVDDITKLPLISKEDILQHGESMIVDSLRKNNLLFVKTSGSTGQPVGFYQDNDILMKEWAYVHYLWKRAGYTPNSSRLVLRGKVFRAMKQKKSNWQWDALRRELSVNIFEMTEENLKIYCQAIEKYKPEFIHGYPSAVRLLCKYIEKHPIRHQFKAVLAVSETLQEDNREYIERVLEARVYSFYGHSERLLIAGECEYSHEYHIEPLYGYAEIIDAYGKPIEEPGVEGELVATGFLNKAMPLIRYKTGDIAAWSSIGECPCGRRHIRLTGVTGRCGKDVLISAKGAEVSMAALNMHSDVFDHIRIFQYVQEEKGKVIFRYVPTEEFCQKDEEYLLEQLMEKFGNDFDICLRKEKEIALGANGKHRLIVQKISKQE